MLHINLCDFGEASACHVTDAYSDFVSNSSCSTVSFCSFKEIILLFFLKFYGINIVIFSYKNKLITPQLMEIGSLCSFFSAIPYTPF